MTIIFGSVAFLEIHNVSDQLQKCNTIGLPMEEQFTERSWWSQQYNSQRLLNYSIEWPILISLQWNLEGQVQKRGSQQLSKFTFLSNRHLQVDKKFGDRTTVSLERRKPLYGDRLWSTKWSFGTNRIDLAMLACLRYAYLLYVSIANFSLKTAKPQFICKGARKCLRRSNYTLIICIIDITVTPNCRVSVASTPPY